MVDEPKRPRSPTFGHIDREQLLRERARPGLSLGVLAGLVTVAIIAFSRAFLFQTFKIPSGSMTPTLQVGDHIFVNKFIYGISFPGSDEKHWRVRLPQVDDVVVFFRFSEFEDRDSNTHYIKRIVAVPGDKVEVKDYITHVNDKPLQRESDKAAAVADGIAELDLGRSYGPVTLKPGEYFVVGDNRSNSRDSRYYGPIHLSDIEGRAEMIYWSWQKEEAATTVRWDRVGLMIH